MKYTVKNLNEYASTKPENSRVVSIIEIEAFSPQDALHKARKFAEDWNRQETRKNMIVTLMVCNGFVTALGSNPVGNIQESMMI